MEQLSLFEDNRNKVKYRSKNSKDYAEFLEKFKEPKTTDDCFTPPAVYDAVLNYVRKRYGLGEEVEIVRPFYPGGNFENYDYPENCVVVDNPPFSIMSRILKFYVKNGIRFFLFCNHLTAFSAEKTIPNVLTYFVCGVTVKYANGAKVSTSFVTNMENDSDVIVLAGVLKREIESAQKVQRATDVVKVVPHPNVMNSARIAKFVRRGDDFAINRKDVCVCRWNKLFGCGFVISSELSNELFSLLKEIPKEIPEEITEEITEEIKLVINKLDDKSKP